MRLFMLVVGVLVSGGSVLFAADEVKVETLVRSDAMWNGTSLPDFTNRETEVSILRITIPPKAEIPMHKHPVINAGYMVSGHLKVTSEKGETLELGPGDTLIELVDQWHMGENLGEEPVVIVVFYMGMVGDKLTIKQSDTNEACH